MMFVSNVCSVFVCDLRNALTGWCICSSIMLDLNYAVQIPGDGLGIDRRILLYVPNVWQLHCLHKENQTITLDPSLLNTCLTAVIPCCLHITMCRTSLLIFTKKPWKAPEYFWITSIRYPRLAAFTCSLRMVRSTWLSWVPSCITTMY